MRLTPRQTKRDKIDWANQEILSRGKDQYS